MEIESKIFFAFINFVFGIGCVSIVLIVLSIIPDCGSIISAQYLTYSVIQSAVNLIILLITTLSMSFLLSVDTEQFLSDTANNFPGYVLIFGVTVVVCLQFCSSLYRYLSIIMPIVSIRIYTKAFVFCNIMGSFLIGANKFVTLLLQKKTLNFSIKQYRWLFNKSVDYYLIKLTIIGAAITVTFLCILSVIGIIIDNLILIPDRRYLNKGQLIKTILTTLSYLLGDLIYCFLIFYSIYLAQPIPNKEIKGFYVLLAVFQGYIQCFIISIWPIVCSFLQYKHMRDAVKIRTQMMLSQEQLTARRRRTSSKKISVTTSAMFNSQRQSIDIEKQMLQRQSTVDTIS